MKTTRFFTTSTDWLVRASRFGNRRIIAFRILAALGLLLWSNSALMATPMTATWNRNTESNIAGYVLSYGTQSGSYTTTLDVGNVTTKQVDLTPGQRYYFVVQAYNTNLQVSPRSAEVAIDVAAAIGLPLITSLSPISGVVGTAVTITGANFGASQGSSTVRFNGTLVTPTSWSATRIVASVPNGATSGLVIVTVGGVPSVGLSFTVAGSPGGSITLTQHAGLQSGGASAALAFPSGNVAGNFIVVVARAFYINQTFTVSDSRGNVYRRAATVNSVDDTLGIFYAENIKAGSNTVTVAVSTTPASLRLAVLEYSGIATSGALDVTAAAAQTSLSPSSGSAMTTGAGDLVIGAFSTQSSRTFTAGSGYTIREAVTGSTVSLMVQDRTLSSAGAVSSGATLNELDRWSAALAAFKKGSSGGTNRPPVLTQPANQSSAENAGVSLQLAASDPDGGAVTYSATGLPSSLSVNPTTGVIAGTLSFTSAGTYSVTATASDGALTSSATFTWTVSNVNQAPTLTQPANQSSAENSSVSLALVASDPDGTALTYGATGLPASLSVNASTGLITGTLTSTSAGSYTVTAGVSDGSLTSSRTFTWTVTDVAQAPNISSLSPTTGTVGTAVTITGTNFGASQGSSTVRFNGTLVTPTSWSATRIVASVPSGATSGAVTVTVSGVSSNGVSFTVTGSSSGPITLTQHAGLQSGGASAALAFPSGNVAGNFIVVVARAFFANQTFTVSDSRGNVYRRAVTVNSVDDTLGIFYAENIKAGSNTVTVAVSTAPASLRLAVLEYSGIATSGALDVTAAAAAASVSPSSGSATTTGAGDLVIGAFSTQSSRTFTAGSGYTIREAVTGSTVSLMVQDRTLSSAGAVSSGATLNELDRWGAALAAFKKGSSGGTQSLTQAQGDAGGASAASRVTPGDFDGDKKTDIAVYRPSANQWRLKPSSADSSVSFTTVWGDTGVIPVTGDYDGDGKVDIAYYRPSSGTWSILKSSTAFQTSRTVSLGSGTDVPVPGDYDGDGVTDIAVYHPATGQWQVLNSSTNYATSFVTVWGASGDVPVPGDYDGDGRFDLAVYRPSTGWWRILQSDSDYAASFTVVLGVSGDVPVPADYDGDGRTDVAMYRPSNGTWNIMRSSNGYAASPAIVWGSSSDVPIPGDYDGDGKADLGLFRAGTWQIRLSSTGYSTNMNASWGTSGDVPLPEGP